MTDGRFEATGVWEEAEQVDLALGAHVNLVGTVDVVDLARSTRTQVEAAGLTTGAVKDASTGAEQSAVTEDAPGGEEHPVADTENKENEVEEVKGEAPKEMTLDEWKAIQNKDRAKGDFSIRKPNEGAGGPWKKGLFFVSQSEEAHAEDSVMGHHFRSQQTIRLGWRSVSETLAAQDEVAGEGEGAVGVGDVQAAAAGLTRRVLLPRCR
uniref:Hyaluronan/mRNA-binding protein domain-containing protein n=1 Tax=Molossus molossus TaxID=27622 RepID=A0A7J8FZF8_MOLMO|nr:hypothetical protein HJG59_008307 [Molossus molossus]